MKTDFYKIKLPLITMAIELFVLLALFVPLILIFTGCFGLTEGVTSGITDSDAVSGWLLLPAMVGDFFVGAFVIIMVFLFLMYFRSIVMTIGWNMMFQTINKEKKVWWFLMAIDCSQFVLLLYLFPVLILIVMLVWQSISFTIDKNSLQV